jgi:glycosyltransferase involved in cell wall biosynthesis
MTRPGKIKVLHLIDGLGGGGSEEWVKEIVRLSSRERFEFVVASIVRGPEDSFSYREEIEKLNVKVVNLEDDGTGVMGGSIEREIDFIRDVMGHYSGSGFVDALWGTLRYAAGKKKLKTLMIAVLKALRILTKLSVMVKREKIDVLHTHLFYAYMFGGLAGKMLHVPVVYSVPAMKSQLDVTHPWVFPMFRRFGFLVNVFMTGIGKEELLDHGGVPPDKVELFHGSIDLDGIRDTSREMNPVVREYNLLDSYPILLSVGRFDPSKGHRYSLQAVKMLRDRFPSIKLIILGEGKDFDRFRDGIIDDDLISSSVILPGFVKDPSYFYSAADIYLRTTLFEGMNRAAYLAMAYAKPMIGFDTGAPTEAIAHGRNGLLIPTGDVGSLAGAIERLAEDRELQKALGSNARSYIAEHQNISDAIGTFEKVYQKLASHQDLGA